MIRASRRPGGRPFRRKRLRRSSWGFGRRKLVARFAHDASLRNPAPRWIGLALPEGRLFDTGRVARIPSGLVDPHVAVLASGAGTNLQALLDHPEVGPAIRLVLSDRPGVGALGRARRAGVEAVVLEPAGELVREAYDRALIEALEGHGIEFVLLAGFMRILGPVVIRAFPERILNVHPSLLPAFPGAHAPRDALAWGMKVTGATVHLVDEQVDHGPIVMQEPVPILPDDDEATLHRRIQEVEHRLYPSAALLLIRGRLKVDGRRVEALGPDGAVRPSKTGAGHG